MSEQSVSYMFGEEVPLASTPDLPPPLIAAPAVAEVPTPVSNATEIQSETPPRHWRRIGRGVYLQTLLQLKRWTDDQLVAAVHAYYPNSRTGVADVKFNCSLIARRVGVQPRSLRLQTELRELLPPPPWDERLSFTYGEVIESSVVATLNSYLDEGETTTSEPLTRAPIVVTQTHNDQPATVPPQVLAHEKQPSRFRKSVDPNREFDKTSLRQGGHMQWVARDTLAHLCRWAFAGRFINGTKDVLDVGCGPDVQMINILTMPRNNVPHSYTGIDLNRQPQKHPNRGWATLHWEFNFLERFQELGEFDVVINMEVIEHMKKTDGMRLLAGLKHCLRADGNVLLSTPCYDGHSAAVHIHEFRVDELQECIESVGLAVEARFGTFASAPAIRKVASPEDLKLIEELSRYYSSEFLSIILAPKYPDSSRNCLWVLRHQ